MLGARGIVLKESPTELLFKGIRSVMAGQHWVGRDTVSALVETLVETIARQQKGAQAPQTRFGLTRRELGVLALIVSFPFVGFRRLVPDRARTKVPA